MNGRDDGESVKGLIQKLPVVKSKHLRKLGAAFGFSAGCGVGFGLRLMGGMQFSVFFLIKLYVDQGYRIKLFDPFDLLTII